VCSFPCPFLREKTALRKSEASQHWGKKKCQDISETWHRGTAVSELRMFFLLET